MKLIFFCSLKLSNEDSQQNFNEENQSRESHYSNNSKQNNKLQKKRSKGQRVDNQLLGFTVQPDPNLKNRGDIEQL